MPTVAAYIITISIGGPVLIELGVPVLSAHMFVLYYAVLSLITPPVMVASFGAAALAEGSVTGTGLSALRFAGLAFIIPFIFVFNPDLLIISAGFDAHARDPLASLTWLANHLSRAGVGLNNGEWVSTGTCTGLDPMAVGETAVADFGDLGAVELTLK